MQPKHANSNPKKRAYYLDSNASAPLSPRARAALIEYGSPDSLIANPSSIHLHGRQIKRPIAEARESIACSLGRKVDPEQLIFTSSGTEANQLAIRSALEPAFDRGEKVHWITTPVEHDSVIQMAEWVKSKGGEVSFFTVNDQGLADFSQLSSLIRPGQTRLVSAIWVNNETGVIHDVKSLSDLCRQFKIPLHVDAAQAWGKIALDLENLQASYVTFSGHKIGGLAGTGLLWVNRGVPVESVVKGKQEKGRRGGTENSLGFIVLGSAVLDLDLSKFSEIEAGRNKLEQLILERIPGVQINGRDAVRVANTLSLSFSGVGGDGLVMALDLAGYSVSSGSACSSGVLEPSHVLLAMGRNRDEAMAAIRISVSEPFTDEFIDRFSKDLANVIEQQRLAQKAAKSRIMKEDSKIERFEPRS